jgi:hypothetical protein
MIIQRELVFYYKGSSIRLVARNKVVPACESELRARGFRTIRYAVLKTYTAAALPQEAGASTYDTPFDKR